jgi:hypothetical protein
MKITQLIALPGEPQESAALVVLGEDGCAYVLIPGAGKPKWEKLPPLPNPNDQPGPWS